MVDINGFIAYLIWGLGSIVLTAVMSTHWPPDERRNLGIYILGYKGSGKSRFMGRVLCLRDLLRGIPQIVIDGVGGLISNILDAVIRLPAPQRRAALGRLVYHDMSGRLTQHVCPLPLFYRLGNESLNDIAWRYLDMILMLDSAMASAPIMGANAITQVGPPINTILAASNWQISEARWLLDTPQVLKTPLKNHLKALQAEATDEGLRQAVAFFKDQYMGWDTKKRGQEAGSYRRKVDLLLRDNASLAIFGAATPGLNHYHIRQQKQTVLLDFSGDQKNPELMRTKMIKVFDDFMNDIKDRVETQGPGLHLSPIGLVIDEMAMLSQLDATSSSDTDIFATRIDELLNLWCRQGMIWPTFANQEKFQISERLFKTLMGCGTLMCGLTSDWEAAVYMASELMPAQPHRVKRYEPVYDADQSVRWYRPIDMTLAEQTQLTAAMFKNLGKFQFLVKEIGPSPVWLLDTTQVDPGLYPDPETLKALKIKLSEHWGVPISDILAEIEQRRLTLQGLKSDSKRDTLKGQPKDKDDGHDHDFFI
ncbi:MAG: hypothetical protein KDI79_31120 [Anaerolineae bacterium]|nr:hypothetical protein [Anaerolineae bacterium]